MEGGSSERTVKSSELSITQTFEFPTARLTIRLRLSINRSVHSCSSLENLCHALLIFRLVSPKSCCSMADTLFGLNVELHFDLINPFT